MTRLSVIIALLLAMLHHYDRLHPKRRQLRLYPLRLEEAGADRRMAEKELRQAAVKGPRRHNRAYHFRRGNQTVFRVQRTAVVAE